jgi:hypothetical protein
MIIREYHKRQFLVFLLFRTSPHPKAIIIENGTHARQLLKPCG